MLLTQTCHDSNMGVQDFKAGAFYAFFEGACLTEEVAWRLPFGRVSNVVGSKCGYGKLGCRGLFLTHHIFSRMDVSTRAEPEWGNLSQTDPNTPSTDPICRTGYEDALLVTCGKVIQSMDSEVFILIS